MHWLSIPNIDLYIVLAILAFFVLVEVVHGHYSNTNRRTDDWILELGGFFLVAATKTAQVLIVFFLGNLLFPQLHHALIHWPLWLSFVVYILLDDFSQYWYHRLAHEYTWLWKHHLSHHAAEEMGILVSYRNSWVYYLMMPNLWLVGWATFLGLAPAVVMSLIFKQLIVTSSHSTWKWDLFFYNNKWLQPVATLIERIIITPAFHHAHHAKSNRDGVGEPNGNFGNTFSIWDQLFGTAHFTRAYPESYGLVTDSKDPWYALLLYPVVKSPQAGSEMAADFQKVQNTGTKPYQEKLTKGTYLYCQCGYSKDQPFCNGFHHGTKKKPLKFEINSDRKVSLCTCKLTKSPPYCDNSHLSI
jgi:sterol desaturase/sphingolipid hydroxylase (fatty acid hydroxylase superfamily)/CDGSH-type Zn-finger protein